jgi:hypothetical protein
MDPNPSFLELPLSLFCQAVELAAQPWPHGDNENHPAMTLLCNWWNSNAPIANHRCAAAAVAFSLPDGLCATNDIAEVGDLEDELGITAKIPGEIMVVFIKSRTAAEDLYPAEPAIRYFDVAGRRWEEVSVKWEEVVSGEYDNAEFAVASLERFPRAFPDQWAALRAALAQPIQ